MKTFSGRPIDGQLSSACGITSLHYPTFVSVAISINERSEKIFEYSSYPTRRGIYGLRAKKDGTLFLVDWRTHSIWLRLKESDAWTLLQDAVRDKNLRQLRHRLKWRERQTFSAYSQFELFEESPELNQIMFDSQEIGGC
jgi:hypothetical protein